MLAPLFNASPKKAMKPGIISSGTMKYSKYIAKRNPAIRGRMTMIRILRRMLRTLFLQRFIIRKV